VNIAPHIVHGIDECKIKAVQNVDTFWTTTESKT
jgi:hypothetical protein